MTRGYTDEADRIMNYLEQGIFDALQKQYLRSFIFAIYLDNKDPTNMVETYTFNFHYHSIMGTDTIIPVMSLGEGLKKMTLGDDRDPVAEAAKRGKPPTLGDVKRSLKRLLKSLIQVTTSMEPLPKRRYATFKVFYTDSTPQDYEPPYFRPADSEKDKWFLMTHDMNEIPDKWSLGKVETGHHSMDVTVQSIVGYLPSSTEHDESTFTGIVVPSNAPSKLTPIQEAAALQQQTEKQIADAEQRNIVWAVEDINMDDPDLDAESEDDPDYVMGPDGQYHLIKTHTAGPDAVVPVGKRNSDGEIVPIIDPSHPPSVDVDADEAHYSGVSEQVPSRVGELKSTKQLLDGAHLEQTQPLDSTQLFIPTAQRHDSGETLHPCGLELSTISSSPHVASEARGIADSSTTTPIRDRTALEDIDMLDIETQPTEADPPPVPESVETIDSFGPTIGVEDSHTPKPAHQKQDEMQLDKGLRCDCGVNVEDECCFCEGGCGRWYHVWCMGYHSTADERLPSKFICFGCRLRADPHWDLIAVELYPSMILKFKDLSLFRRAIKIAENDNSSTASAFSKSIGCDNEVAQQLFKRLEAEAQIVNGFGITETRNKSKGKSKLPKRRKNIQKPKFAFNRASVKTTEYNDYFNPDPTVERRMLGLPQLSENFKAHARFQNQAANIIEQCDSQTQEETQALLPMNQVNATKRSVLDPETGRPTKKVKVSVTLAVDLAE